MAERRERLRLRQAPEEEEEEGGREMTSWPPSLTYDFVSKIGLDKSVRICLKNNAAKFRSDP